MKTLPMKTLPAPSSADRFRPSVPGGCDAGEREAPRRVGGFVGAVLVAGLVLLGVAGSAQAQSHFKDCATRTATNATIIIPVEAQVRLNGVPLERGDEIAVFGSNGACVGSVVWTGQNLALTAWGMDAIGAVPGLETNEPMQFRVWDASTQTEYGPANSRLDLDFGSGDSRTHFTTENRYVPNGIYLVDTLSVRPSEDA